VTTPTIKDLPARLEAFLSELLGTPVQLSEARQLAGGASRDAWAVVVAVAEGPQAGRHPLVLRRDLGGEILPGALSREQEFNLLRVVHDAGVRAPRPRWLGTDAAALGAPFFLMDRLEGESVGRRVVREPALAEARRRLPAQMAEQLALLHAVPTGHPALAFLPRPAEGQSPALAAVESGAGLLGKLGEPHPALELAARWLRRHAPPCPELVLVHGDFRVGNLMVGPEGLVGVFDWEFAHVGDPAEDLAWPCVRSWRFGEDGLRLGGVAAPDEFLAEYERRSGRSIDRGRVAYWEILGNFRWAVGCMAQADRHLSGQTVSVELASLGRRTAEVELELLELIGRAEGVRDG
jgi:aminoglycoside phosphotransferase (APT) family kinase protein